MLWVIVSIWALLGCNKTGVVIGEPPSELDQPTGIEVLFNHNEHSTFRNPLTGNWRHGDDFEAFLLKHLKQAKREVLVAVQELTLPSISQALVKAHQRGVDVKLVVENNYSNPWGKLHEADLTVSERQRLRRLKALADQNHDGALSVEERIQGDAIQILINHHIPLIDDTEDGSKGSGLMHHKFVIIDGHTVITGSTNFTSSGFYGDANSPRTRGNVNHLLSLQSIDLANIFRAEFLQLWGDGPGGKKDSQFGRKKKAQEVETAVVKDSIVEVLFTPHSAQDDRNAIHWISKHLSQANKTIDLALFVFSEQSLANTLQENVKSGLRLRLLADPSFANRSFSEVLDLLGLSLSDRFCKIEAGNSPWPTPFQDVGTPHLSRGDKLHHKFGVIDNNKVITGSFNWSPSAAFNNDETILIIHSAQLAKHFTREMNRLWRGAELGITDRMRRKMVRQQQICGNGVERR